MADDRVVCRACENDEHDDCRMNEEGTPVCYCPVCAASDAKGDAK